MTNLYQFKGATTSKKDFLGRKKIRAKLYIYTSW